VNGDASKSSRAAAFPWRFRRRARLPTILGALFSTAAPGSSSYSFLQRQILGSSLPSSSVQVLSS
jgi:hypothetical protein